MLASKLASLDGGAVAPLIVMRPICDLLEVVYSSFRLARGPFHRT